MLITVGGGGDGYTIIDQYLEGLRLLKGNCPWHSVVVLGPLMSEELRRAARAKAKSLTGVAVIDFTPHLSDHLAAADVVLTMAGYNTLLEALALGKRVVAVPRVKPRTEQLIRSLKFQRLGLLRCVDPRPSTPAGLVAAVKKAMLGPPPAVASQLDLGGMKRMLKVLAEVLEDDPAQARLREWNGAGAHFADPAHNHA